MAPFEWRRSDLSDEGDGSDESDGCSSSGIAAPITYITHITYITRELCSLAALRENSSPVIGREGTNERG
jgi:hypothetical protein